MIVGHSRPKGVTFSIDGTGAAILSPTAELTDGRPDTVTRLQWLSGAQSSVTSILRLRMDWPIALVPRVVGLFGTSLPDGLYTTVRFRRASDTIGTYPYAPPSLNDNQRLQTDPRGLRSRIELLAPGASPVLGCEFAFLNNVGGVATIPASALHTLGDLAVCAGTDVDIEPGWSIEPVDAPAQKYSWPYRRFTWQPRTSEIGDVFGTTAGDLETLLARLDNRDHCIFVPRHTHNGVFSGTLLHRLSIFGYATDLPKITHSAGSLFASGQCVVTDEPFFT